MKEKVKTLRILWLCKKKLLREQVAKKGTEQLNSLLASVFIERSVCSLQVKICTTSKVCQQNRLENKKWIKLPKTNIPASVSA